MGTDTEAGTTTAEVIENFRTDLNGALDDITEDGTISDDARAELIKKFEGIGDLLDEASEILRKESSEEE